MSSRLYHYTSLENLALILKNKTIRFSSLSRVDDIEEMKTKDFGDLGRFCFVSCWTDTSKESIPLWEMYTPKMTGVRISLPVDPFEEEILPSNGKEVKSDIVYSKGLLEFQKKFNVLIPPPYKAELVSVTYTNDETLLNPRVKTEDKDTFSLDLKNIGRFKRSAWSFQEEVRYKITVYPFSQKDLRDSVNDDGGRSQIIERLQNNVLPINYIDLSIRDEAYAGMEILCGPKMTEGQKIIVSSLVEKYSPTSKIENSSIKIS